MEYVAGAIVSTLSPFLFLGGATAYAVARARMRNNVPGPDDRPVVADDYDWIPRGEPIYNTVRGIDFGETGQRGGVLGINLQRLFPERQYARVEEWVGGNAEFAPNAWEGYDYAEWQRQHPHLNRLSHVGDVALALGGTALAANWIRSMHMSTDKARDDATKNTPYNPETQSLAPSPIEEPYYASRQQTQRVD